MIKAKIILHSTSNGIDLYTLQTKAPKFLDAEFEKHRMISSNSSSDRAIPFLKMIDNGYHLPKDVRLNQPGMQGDLLLDEDSKEEFWNILKDIYGYTSNKLMQWDRVHKQHLNRYLIGFSWQNKICSATEWENFFNLRLHRSADPAMYELARVMFSALQASKPIEMKPDEWHLPYTNFNEIEKYWFSSENTTNLSIFDIAVKCSIARCARVSYNNHDNSSPDVQKDIELADKLIAAGHMSPSEHQATPMKWTKDNDYVYLAEADYSGPLQWERGITHMDREDNLWSGNFHGWIMYRKLL